ncbi:ThiF family adenylyltransferase [Pelosinus propionicus]|uniref:ThiF family protein n=1 Tax=Pelosinus propionicus DSM 13327 TaxID=1123291 RepID=A0A1I4PGA8_9FIRM|nr:ThiF family adenylyltransferase [Pelosinus propionicus]SFM26744.1 ThiF family protein [Pelosinus propionicus DSM 13327]
MDIEELLTQEYLKSGFTAESDDNYYIFIKEYSFINDDTTETTVKIAVKYDKEYPLRPPQITDLEHILSSMHSWNGFQCWARFSDIFPQVGLGLIAPNFVEEQIMKLISAHKVREYSTIHESPEFAFIFEQRKAVEHTPFYVSLEALQKVVMAGQHQVIRGIAHKNPRGYMIDGTPNIIDASLGIALDNTPQGNNRIAYFLNVGAIPHFDGRVDDIIFLNWLEALSGIQQNEVYLQNIAEEIFVVAVFFNKNLGHHDVVVFRKNGTKLTLFPHARVSSRSVLFSRHKEEAMKLRKKKIALVGIGAIGSVLGMSLLQSGIDHLYILDPDYVDLENTTRSIYVDSDVGSLKIDAFKKNASIKDADFSDRVTELENFDDIYIYNPDLIIICIGSLYDEYSISLRLRRSKFEKAVFVFGQNDCTWGAIYFQDSPKLGCQQCLFLHQREDISLQMPYVPYISEAVGCGNPSYVSTPSDIGLLANLAAKLIIERLTQEAGKRPNYFIWQSNPEPCAWKDSHTEHFSIKKYRIEKHAECQC